MLENVPGLLSHDQGKTFSKILTTLQELGYSVEWCVCDSKYYVPQSRRRVYITGFLDERGAGKVFPIAGASAKALVQIKGGTQGSRIYDAQGIACTQTAQGGGGGGRTGLYFVDMCKGHPEITENARCITARQNSGITNFKGATSGVLKTGDEDNTVLLIKEATKKGYKLAMPGDSVTLSYPGSNTKRGRVGKNIAHTLVTSGSQGVVVRNGRIRRLIPKECLRLQGFSDEQADKILAITSDAQAYKQAGNAVTVDVVAAIGEKIREVANWLENTIK